MPKMGIHGIVLSDAVRKLKTMPETQNVGLNIEQNIDWAMLGAVGPDLFFWAPDYEMNEKLWSLWQTYQEWVSLYNTALKPIRWIKTEVIDPVGDALDDYIPDNSLKAVGDALKELRQTASILGDANSTMWGGVFTQIYADKFFSSFKPALQNNSGEENWLWFDTLHYRNTGDFARKLVENAENGTGAEKAYAFGYLSHIATDVIGHPFVNQIVGGPFRLHIQRHITVENWMDTRMYNYRYDENITTNLNKRLGFPSYSKLPTTIRDLLYKTFQDTYQNVPHPNKLSGGGFLSKKNIEDTYEMFVTVLHIMNDTHVSRPEEPFSNLLDILAESYRAIADQFKDFPDPPPSPSESCDWDDILGWGDKSGECWDKFIEEAAEYLGYPLKILDWTAKSVVAVIDALIATLASIPLAHLLALLYLIQLGLYELWVTIRGTIAENGYVYPMPDALNSGLGRNLTTPFQCLIENFKYPRKSKGADTSHLACPPSAYEKPITAVNFNLHENSDIDPGSYTPEYFISQVPFDFNSLEKYALAKSPEETRALHRESSRIGNAVNFTTWMIKTASAQGVDQSLKSILYTNWNLDGDRGYGYKTWSGLVPENGSGNVIDEKYVG